ncbi:hypothetical protein L208DRAFT_1222090, partial [Tricholoma matsutake]
DSSNWATYCNRMMNYLTSKGLKRHVLGTARQRRGMSRSPDPLRLSKEMETCDHSPYSNEIAKHEEEQDNYEQKQASVCEVIYRTINNSTFLQVKNETDATAVWKKVVSIH